VLLVVQQHAVTHQHDRILSLHPYLAFVERYVGVLGVKIFFVISGFVICRLLLLEERKYGAASLKGFYLRRIFRIIPPFAFYLGTVSLLLYFGLIIEPWKAILGAALFMSDIHVWPWGRFVGHIWSLAVEEQFYLTFPPIFVFAPRRWRNYLVFGCLATFVLWSLSMTFTGWDSLVSGDVRTGFVCICCGVLMALHRDRVHRLVSRVPAFVVVLIGITLVLHPVVSDSLQGALYESLLVPPSIGILLVFTLERQSWLRSVLCSRPAQAIGITSYGIYLWQQLFTVPAWTFPAASHTIPMLLPLLVIIVPLSYFLVEKPSMRYGKALSRRAIESSTSAKAVASILQAEHE